MLKNGLPKSPFCGKVLKFRMVYHVDLPCWQNSKKPKLCWASTFSKHTSIFSAVLCLGYTCKQKRKQKQTQALCEHSWSKWSRHEAWSVEARTINFSLIFCFICCLIFALAACLLHDFVVRTWNAAYVTNISKTQEKRYVIHCKTGKW